MDNRNNVKKYSFYILNIKFIFFKNTIAKKLKNTIVFLISKKGNLFIFRILFFYYKNLVLYLKFNWKYTTLTVFNNNSVLNIKG